MYPGWLRRTCCLQRAALSRGARQGPVFSKLKMICHGLVGLILNADNQFGCKGEWLSNATRLTRLGVETAGRA
jgi:hypothetical protein